MSSRQVDDETMEPGRYGAVETIRRRVGWVYPELPWLTSGQAEIASRRRDELLAALAPNVELSFGDTKVHLGSLSPGCSICGTGSWGCNYINGLCTRQCFFCPQDRTRTEEREPMTAGNLFLDPEEHVRYLRALGIEGVGFSGGEPLLVVDRLVAHIEAIRRHLGSGIYVWVYTNGDPADATALGRLRRAGLDEVRFNLAARGYDLTPLRIATGHVPAVSVEIPAIPEHLERLKGVVIELDRIGVAFLNLHQLFATEYNYTALRRRGYHFLHQPSVPVLESELCALELLAFIRDRGLAIGAQYCSSAFKSRFQERGRRLQLARLAAGDADEVTDAGYLRRLLVTGPPAALSALARRLDARTPEASGWRYEEQRGVLAVRGADLTGLTLPAGVELSLVYSEATLEIPRAGLGDGEPGFGASTRVVHRLSGLGPAGLSYWRRLYVEGQEPEGALRAFFRDYRFADGGDVRRFRDEATEVRSVGAFERVETGFPEIF